MIEFELFNVFLVMVISVIMCLREYFSLVDERISGGWLVASIMSLLIVLDCMEKLTGQTT